MFEINVKAGDTIRDHRDRPVKIGHVAPLRADARVWGVYSTDGALIVRVNARKI